MTTPDATSDDGHPSIADRVRLADDLQDQLASSRLAWEAALLRSDAALATGDAADVQTALDDHRELLGALEERLGAVVAAATVARDAEGIDSDRSTRLEDGPATEPDDRVAAEAPAEPTAAPIGATRRGASALLGAAAAVLVVAGLLVGDLALDPDSMVAGTSTVSDAEVRARIASQRVAEFGERTDLSSDLRRQRGDLPRFSGDIPPTSTTGDSAPRRSDVGPDGTAEAPGASGRGGVGADTTPQTPTPPVPEPRVETPDLPVDRPAPDAPSRVPLAEPLVEPDTAPGADLRSASPEPSGDVEETLGTPSPPPVTSDPTSGLG